MRHEVSLIFNFRYTGVECYSVFELLEQHTIFSFVVVYYFPARLPITNYNDVCLRMLECTKVLKYGAVQLCCYLKQRCVGVNRISPKQSGFLTSGFFNDRTQAENCQSVNLIKIALFIIYIFSLGLSCVIEIRMQNKNGIFDSNEKYVIYSFTTLIPSIGTDSLFGILVYFFKL